MSATSNGEGAAITYGVNKRAIKVTWTLPGDFRVLRKQGVPVTRYWVV